MSFAPIIYMLLSLFTTLLGSDGTGLAWTKPADAHQEVSVSDGAGGVSDTDAASEHWEEQATDHRKAAIAAAIDPILADERLTGAIAGVSIRHAESGELLYSHMGDIGLHPASSMKLLTAAAALQVLGADYRFSTELWTDGRIIDGVLTGNVYLKGKGDPTLLQEDLARFASELKEKGVRRIEGHLIGDDSWYDAVRLSQDMDWSDEMYYYGSQVSALTLSPNTDYDTGTVIVEVLPAAKTGAAAVVTVSPETGYVTIVNRAVTGSKGGQSTIKVEREHGTNRIIVEGTIPLEGSASRTWVSVWEPTGYVLDVFRRALNAEGISVEGILSEPLTGITPDGATLLASKESAPLRDILIPFMKLSNNGIAEMLTKEMGRIVYNEGSWERGLQVIRDTVAQFGMDPRRILLRDGSGMSHLTMIPSDQLSMLLYSVQKADWYPLFEQSLPVAGASDRMTGGTLRWRLLGTAAQGKVKAKTGSLNTVSSLAGYVTTRDGEKLIFSILINNYLVNSVKPIEDAIVVELARLKWN